MGRMTPPAIPRPGAGLGGPAITHLCGPDGCTTDVSPPGESAWLAERRLAWSAAYEAATGEFPDLDTQLDFMVAATAHYRAVVWPALNRVRQRRAGMRLVRATGGAA